MKSKCKSIIKKLNLSSEKGSSSVLVIMIMLLLITFGVLAMMSSYSNLKIARKHAEWTKTYYQLESAAEKNKMDFDQLYQLTVDEMSSYTAEELSISIKESSLPEVVKVELQKQLVTENDNRVKQKLFLYLLYDKFFNSYLYHMDADGTFNYDIVNKEISPEWEAKLSYITIDESSKRRMLVSFKIDLSNYKNLPEIDQWRELPQEFQYDEGINFNDPEGN